MMKTNEYSYIKTAVICVIIILNMIMNSLVIAVIARYPQLREDRTTLFMFSLSVSDLAAGCTFMPISAVLCSRVTPGVVDTVGLLPKIHAFTMWWFGFNSMYSLCWLTISKAIVILNPFKVERFLTRKRCYIIVGMNWMIGGLLAISVFTRDILGYCEVHVWQGERARWDGGLPVTFCIRRSIACLTNRLWHTAHIHRRSAHS